MWLQARPAAHSITCCALEDTQVLEPWNLRRFLSETLNHCQRQNDSLNCYPCASHPPKSSAPYLLNHETQRLFAGMLISTNLSSYLEPPGPATNHTPPGHRLPCAGLQGPYGAGPPDVCGLAHWSWLPPPGQRPPRVQEGSQEPGSQRLLNQQPSDQVQAGAGREGVRLQGLRGPEFLPATPPGGLHGSGPVRRAGPRPWAVPPPCHQTLLPSPSLEGGTREAGPGQLGCRPGCSWKLCSFPCSPRGFRKSW